MVEDGRGKAEVNGGGDGRVCVLNVTEKRKNILKESKGLKGKREERK